jgi:hypothetical protein
MGTENHKCENCEYYQRRQGQQDGICHIRSPQVVTAINVKGVGMPKTGWPIVQKDDWCGKFKGKAGKPSKELIDAAKRAINA